MNINFQVDYLTEDPAPQYAKDIRAAKSKSELVKKIEKYLPIVDDAYASAQKITDAEFKRFKVDIKKAEKQQPEMWIKKFNAEFGAIAMPRKMILSSMTAMHFGVPWGTAYIRSEEEKWPQINHEK